jgi:uncharacterized protein (DUF1786 family)
MKILTVDIGTGTQDIFLYQSGLEVENGFKLVVPSPTMIVNKQIREASKKGEPLALSGVTMGGGPSHWAARDHVKAGYKVYATPDAARSFDDDLDQVRKNGIDIISDDELKSLPASVRRLELKDFDLEAISNALSEFGVRLDDLDAAALAVFDHGAAPPGYSDRQFRFDYLAERLKPDLPGPALSRLAFKRGEIPQKMTRLLAVEKSASGLDCPLMVMDTAPAAILGATLDPVVRSRKRVLAANIGNFHSLAFRLNQDQVEGVFEHHTGLIDREKMEDLLIKFAGNVLTHEEIFGDHGHGAIIHDPTPFDLNEGDFNIVVTGPRRNLLRGSNLRPYYAAPYGDMMLTGCFGLLAAIAESYPDMGETIKRSLYRNQGEESGLPPWELD